MSPRRTTWVLMGLLLWVWVILGGCSSLMNRLGLSEQPSSPPAPKYYDFPDVLVPEELSLDRDGSVIYEAGGIKAGLLLFKGRVEARSLEDFFRQFMPQDGWTLASSVRFNRLLLNFVKPDRSCQIIIRDRTFNTEVEIWVHPLKTRASS